MAGLCGVKILLLWAGIIGLGKCDLPSTAVPPVQCSYTVNPIRYGIQINITSSAVVKASIEINEEGKPETKQVFTVLRFDQTSSHPIKQLKPCTKYNAHVKVHYSNETTSCNIIGNDTSTSEIHKDDIAFSGRDKSVCFQTEWNISSISVQTNGTVVNNSVCVKPNYADLCSDLTLIFTSQSCNTSFPFTRNISLDYLDPKDIQETFLNKFPTNITAKLPPKCKNLSIDYTCHKKKNVNEIKKLSELEPFTDYSCTGHIKDNNVPINKTTEVLVQINCDLKITITTRTSDNTSLELTWKTASEDCEAGIPKLSYNCSCRSHEWHENSSRPSEETCKISGLSPFTDYNCLVTATYNNFLHTSPPVHERTKVGVPEKVTQLKLMVKEHNTINVTCKLSQERFNGRNRRFKARLLYNGTDQLVTEKNSTGCDFKFDNLYYSTSYKVEVFAVNSELESKPEIKSISTDYNDKAVIGFLVFLIIFTSVALLLVIYKIFILKRRKSY
ncbi:receptor-type tyrosine-protein phosphatase C-like isoform X2 [Paralichthys olivaceus]|uniref:receptor-type tyrosine-protein phosphatase C-like isoform X2 n=1 Tax=Paralichthys olivaceus TaxID=8255 RepID=UPI003752F615